MTPFPALFSEISLGNITLPNRVMMAAMSTGLADPRGRITEEQIAYYQERARGGVGLVMVEFACVASEYGISEATQVVLDSDDFIPGHVALVKAVQAEGAVAGLQLQMPGQFAYRSPGLTPVAPDEVRSRRDGSVRARSLAAEEVEAVVGRFRDAARRAVEAGYDLIELHGAHGYLLHAFLSPALNHRADEWGGDFERRLAFPRAVIAAIKQELEGRPLLYRISADDYTPGSLAIDDMERIAPLLVAAGVDGIDVSTGSLSGSLERAIDPMSIEGWRFDLAERIKRVVDVPVAAIGSRWPATAENALQAGRADIIALGRPLLADPDWVRKARSGGAPGIRPCTSCNWCADRVFQHLPTGCAENPRAGRERVRTLGPDVGGSRRVVVVGAGPGGMAAAIQADSVGFDVVLLEREPVLGGGLIASAAPPGKQTLLWYRDYLLARLRDSGVDVRTGVSACVESVLALEPFAVILANGTVPTVQGIPGEDAAIVQSAYSLLLGNGPDPAALPGPAVVYGGGETGCETAELLASHDLDVTLVSRSDTSQLARAAEPLYRKVLMSRLRSNAHITLAPHTSISAIGASDVEIEDTAGVSTRLPTETVILAQGRDSADLLHAELAERGVQCIKIGDARQIARIGEAVHQANEAIRLLAGTGAEAPPA